MSKRRAVHVRVLSLLPLFLAPPRLSGPLEGFALGALGRFLLAERLHEPALLRQPPPKLGMQQGAQKRKQGKVPTLHGEVDQELALILLGDDLRLTVLGTLCPMDMVTDLVIKGAREPQTP